MSTLKTVKVGDAIVVREFFPWGERAYRITEGRWDYCPDHKGPWLRVTWEEVPDRIKDCAMRSAP